MGRGASEITAWKQRVLLGAASEHSKDYARSAERTVVMIPAWYMQFTPGHHGALDRIGGLPTHLPRKFPFSGDGKRPLMFIAQFHCDGTRLRLGDTFLLQIYKDVAEGIPDPVVIRVPHGDP